MTNELRFLKSSFTPKYEKLMSGKPYGQCFSNIDGWLFYNTFEEIGIINLAKEVRQKEWDNVRLNLDWWKNENRKPHKEEVVNETKHRLFKNWVNNHFEIGSTVYEIFDLSDLN